jgi:hypothetical protein
LRRLLPETAGIPMLEADDDDDAAPRLAPRGGASWSSAPRAPEAAAPGVPGRRVSEVERLLAARDFWERHAALQRLFLANRELYLSAYDPPFPEILREEDPDIMAWKLATALFERSGSRRRWAR